MNEPKQENPVSRLHGFMVKGRSQPDSSPLKVWSAVFDLEIESTPKAVALVVEKLILLMDLIREAERGIREIDGSDSVYFEAFDPIRQVINTSLQSLAPNRNALFGPVGDREVTLLELASRDWSRRRREPQVDEAQLEDILKRTRELQRQVRKSLDIDENLRKIVLSLLSSIEQAINNYWILGPSALEKGAAQFLGLSHLYGSTIEESPKGSSGSGFVKKVGAIFGALMAAVTFADRGISLIERSAPVVDYLTAGEPQIPAITLPAITLYGSSADPSGNADDLGPSVSGHEQRENEK